MIPMRRFELTISVYYPDGEPLPDTFAEWLERATGVSMENAPATPTTLERIVETRYPLARDVIEKRVERRSRPWA
jgi:hypothetical protein